MSDFYLWFDVETSDLDTADLTVFEAGWTVTDDQLEQRTPLRSRLTVLPTGGGQAVIPVDQDLHGGWTKELHPAVVAMHGESGLRAELLDAFLHGEVEDSPGALDQAIWADVLNAGYHSDEDNLFLAGAGVAHFDWFVLLNLGSELFEKLHYRPADLSSAFTVLGQKAPKDPEQLREFWKQASRAAAFPFELIELETDESTHRLRLQDPVQQRLDFDAIRKHRAADDVAYALVAARCLRVRLLR